MELSDFIIEMEPNFHVGALIIGAYGDLLKAKLNVRNKNEVNDSRTEEVKEFTLKFKEFIKGWKVDE